MEQFVDIKYAGMQEQGIVTFLATMMALKGGGIKHGRRIARVVLHFALQKVVSNCLPCLLENHNFVTSVLFKLLAMSTSYYCKVHQLVIPSTDSLQRTGIAATNFVTASFTSSE